MFEPENNAVKLKSLDRIINLYPKCNLTLHDVCCKLAPEAVKSGKYEQIKFWCIDKWHAKKHGKHCKYSPYNDTNLEKRLDGVNTSTSEQLFSWFRRYSRVLNEMRQKRHHFLILYYSKCHNDIISKGKPDYRNAYSYQNKERKRKNLHRFVCQTAKDSSRSSNSIPHERKSRTLNKSK